MALTPVEAALIGDLSRRHDSEILELEALDRYYEGTQPLTYMHPEILREVSDRIRPVIINWPQMVVDSVEERLRLEGFKTGDRDLDAEIWRVWLASEMQIGFRMAMVDSMVMRRAFICVGTNEEDAQTPLVTPESPLEVYVDVDPRTRKVRSALRRVNEVDAAGGVGRRYATLYQPNETVWCTWDGGWVEERRDQHGLGRVPVVPLVNRPRLRGATRAPRNLMVERMGRSDLDPIIPLSDSANKLATDMMVAAEFVAIPLRALFGVDDFKDEHGNPQSPLQAMLGRVLTIPNENVKAFEFAAAQLGNFTTALGALAETVASVSGLPPHYLGMSSDNPASAEAIAGSEARLATRAERKQDSGSTTAVRVARLIRRFQTGSWDDDLVTMSADWRNVRTPTVAAMADAAVKLYQTTPKPIVPLRQTRERLGFDDAEIVVMEEEDEKAAELDPVGQLVSMTGADRMPARANGRAPVAAGANA